MATELRHQGYFMSDSVPKYRDKITSQTTKYLVILSSKIFVFEDKLTKY